MLGRVRRLVGAPGEVRRLEAELAQTKKRLRKARRRGGTPIDSFAASDAPLPPERLAWIFGAGRSGSTWLASMLGTFGTVWNEPLVGALFGGFYKRYGGENRGRNFFMSPAHKAAWLGGVREMVLTGATHRYPNLRGPLVIKEPHGSVGAPFLSEALPESRLVLLVRDPRDVVASELDARKDGAWLSKVPREVRWGETASEPDLLVERHAEMWRRDTHMAYEAYSSHAGPKAFVRYEDLRNDPVEELWRLCSELALDVDYEDVSRAVETHSWENIPEEKRGAGKFYRKATPGSWQEDLTREQAKAVENATRPLLDRFYPERPEA